MNRTTWAWVLLATGAVCACSSDESSSQKPSVDAGSEATGDAAEDAVPDAHDADIPDQKEDATQPADWVIRLDSTSTAGSLSPALLGHYDLSGPLYEFDAVPGLPEAMQAAGFTEWRVSVGRWESMTLLLPELSDGTACASPIAQAMAPAGTTDLDLIEARDWFVDDGQPVALADTQDDARYALTYVRSVIDTASALGAAPFVSIDHMPRALSANRDPERTDCAWSSMNRVSNVRPSDPLVFAAAAEGLVKRVMEGSGGEPGRSVPYWEVWNEPEFPQFWDPTFETGLDRFFEMAILTLVRLHDYRTASGVAEVQNTKFGFSSFALADTAATALTALDTSPLPDGSFVPFDFVSFHAYYDDPLEVVDAIEKVADAVAGSTNYQDVELVLAEWGPDLATNAGDPVYNGTMDAALHPATVLALGANAGLDRAHRSIFWAYFPGMGFGVLDHDVNPRPAYYAYQLLASVIHDGAERVAPTSPSDARFEGGMGAVLTSAGADGKLRTLVINRTEEARTVSVEVEGATAVPVEVQRFSDPGQGIETVTPASGSIELPAESMAVIVLDGY